MSEFGDAAARASAARPIVPRASMSSVDTASAPGRSPSLGYSRALDGLRAVAVLAVMLYHGGVAVVTGGFLGVDVFFVLSGFLIMSLLLKEHAERGEIDLKAFWGRRARRLLPALFIVLAVILVFSLWAVGVAGRTMRNDSVATLFYVSNWWYVIKGQSYFDAFNDPSPLTHSWSLAIEEQWYLILPIVLIPLLRRVAWSALLSIIVVAALMSATLMAVLRIGEASGARLYYGTDTRIQALLIGAALGVIFTQGGLERFSRFAGPAAALSAVGAIAFMAVASELSGWLYLGGFLAFALIVAVLVAAVVTDPTCLVARALSTRLLVAVGKISYGLYLWHWPVYVLMSPARTGISGGWLFAARLTATFGAATASYFLVERPIRGGALTRVSPRAGIGAAVAVPVSLLVLAACSAATSRPPASDSLEAISAAAKPPTAAPSSASNADGAGSATAIMVGDSNALGLMQLFRPEFAPGLTVYPGTSFGCGVIPFTAVVQGQKLEQLPQCQGWKEGGRATAIKTTKAEVGVLMGGSWEMYDRWVDGRTVPYTSAEWRRLTESDYTVVLNELKATSKRLVVVTNSCHQAPQVDLPLPILFQSGKVPEVTNDPKRVAATNKALLAAASKLDVPVRVVDLNQYLCSDGYTEDWNGKPMRSDGLHFNENGAARIWPWMGPQLLDVDGLSASPSASTKRDSGNG